jgi:hypothetical protein
MSSEASSGPVGRSARYTPASKSEEALLRWQTERPGEHTCHFSPQNGDTDARVNRDSCAGSRLGPKIGTLG